MSGSAALRPGAAATPVRFEWGGEEIELRPELAALLPAHRTLLVADVHLGKARAFRQQGVPVPGGTTRETLARLDAVVRATGVRHVVFLGDLLHSRHAQGSAALGEFARWREAWGGLALTLVRGNHDARAGDPPPALGITVVAEPLAVGALALCHRPDLEGLSPGGFGLGHVPPAGQPARIAGHVHPCCSLHGRRDSLRLPCFHFGARVAVLPAFGEFTGMHSVRRAEGDRVWVVAADRVVAVPERATAGLA
jgi:DNA ligase-associated metallophosphoesterase